MSVLRCPICQRPFESDESAALPFCSGRCKQIDLGRWLDERYGLPCEPEGDEPDANGRHDSQGNGRGEYYSD